MKVSKESELVDRKVLVLSYSYSNTDFVQPVPAENQECFLEALKRLFENLEKLEKELDERSSLDMERPHYHKGDTIKELWNEEKRSLKKLPSTPYEVYRIDSMLVNNYGEVKVDKMPIIVFGPKPGTYLPVKILWDRIEVLDNEYNLLTSVPRAYTDKIQEVHGLKYLKDTLENHVV